MCIQPSIAPLVETFRCLFSLRSHHNFAFLLANLIGATRQRAITVLLREGVLSHEDLGLWLNSPKAGQPKHHSVYHRFFTRAKWDKDAIGMRILHAFMEEFSCLKPIRLLVDDTLCRRSGPMILGGGIHVDPLRSTSHKGNRRKVFSAGHVFVVVALYLPLPYIHGGGLAIPILTRLYRTKKTCPPDQHTKKTELATQMLARLGDELEGHHVEVVADSDYSNKTVLAALPKGFSMVGVLPAKAVLHEVAVVQRKGRGRKRKWGERRRCPLEEAALAGQAGQSCVALGDGVMCGDAVAVETGPKWEREEVRMYGRSLRLDTLCWLGTWKRAGPDCPLRIVVSRDPDGYYKDRFFFSTDTEAKASEVLESVGRRWAIEVAFRSAKQELGLEQVHNGFVQQRRGRQGGVDERATGHQYDPKRVPVAARRTVPFALVGAYGMVVLWFVRHAEPLAVLQDARRRSPWYTHKIKISFADMRRTFLQQLNLEIQQARDGLLEEAA